MGWVGDIIKKEMLIPVERYLEYRDMNHNIISSTFTYLFSSVEYSLMREKIRLASLFYDALNSEDLSQEQYGELTTSPKSLVYNPFNSESAFSSSTPIYSIATPNFAIDLCSTPQSISSFKVNSLEHKNSSSSLLSMDDNKFIKNNYSVDTESQISHIESERLLQKTETIIGTNISAVSYWVSDKIKEVKKIRNKYNEHQPGVYDAILSSMHFALQYLCSLVESCKEFDKIIQHDNNVVAKTLKLHLNYLYIFAYDLALARNITITAARKDNFYLGSGIHCLPDSAIYEIEEKIQANISELIKLREDTNLGGGEQRLVLAVILDKFITYTHNIHESRPEFLEQCSELRTSLQPIVFSTYPSNRAKMSPTSSKNELPKIIDYIYSDQIQLNSNLDKHDLEIKNSTAKLVG